MVDSILDQSRREVIVVGPDFASLGKEQAPDAPAAWPNLLDWPLPGLGGGSTKACRLRPHVRLIVQDAAARVLDTKGGTFYALDLVGTRMLFSTLETDSETMVRTLAAAYGIADEQIREDWAALVAELHRANLVEAVCPQRQECRPPGALRIWWWLTLAWLSFSILGWERTLKRWRPSRARLACLPDDPHSVVNQVDGLVRRMASRHPLNPQCKERSLVSWYVLRRMGLPARLVMGVLLYPFTAHAWTECHGRIVGDDRARCEQFVAVAAYE